MPDHSWGGSRTTYLEVNLPHEQRFTFYVTAIVPGDKPRRALTVGRLVAELARIRLTDTEETPDA